MSAIQNLSDLSFEQIMKMLQMAKEEIKQWKKFQRDLNKELDKRDKKKQELLLIKKMKKE